MLTALSQHDRLGKPASIVEPMALSLHDALPVSSSVGRVGSRRDGRGIGRPHRGRGERDRKSTRLNSSHGYISYAVFCLIKKWRTKSWYRNAASFDVGPDV